MIKCPSCKTENIDEAIYCYRCGQKLPQIKTCGNPQCGNPLPVGAVFCPECGCRVLSLEPKIGDYYYSDGTYSSELINNKECVGVVFSLNTTEEEKKYGWTHGHIIALKNAKLDVLRTDLLKRNFTNKDCGFLRWGYNVVHPIEMFGEYEYKKLRNDREGFSYTMQLFEESGCEAFCAAKSFPVSLPKNKTSGWYLPAIGQWLDVVENLASLKFRLDHKSMSTYYEDGCKLKDVYEKTKIFEAPFRTYFSSTQNKAERCFVFSCKEHSCEVSTVSKYSGLSHVRPVAAF